jgi:hypothetical protein
VADQIIVQYIGFTARALVREYSFLVRDESGQPREYTVTIANEAFVSHRVRYQDGPNICSRRLRRELAASVSDPSVTQFCITDPELADYNNGSVPKAASHSRKQEQD